MRAEWEAELLAVAKAVRDETVKHTTRIVSVHPDSARFDGDLVHFTFDLQAVITRALADEADKAARP